jgi:hypothetical protein
MLPRLLFSGCALVTCHGTLATHEPIHARCASYQGPPPSGFLRFSGQSERRWCGIWLCAAGCTCWAEAAHRVNFSASLSGGARDHGSMWSYHEYAQEPIVGEMAATFIPRSLELLEMTAVSPHERVAMMGQRFFQQGGGKWSRQWGALYNGWTDVVRERRYHRRTARSV